MDCFPGQGASTDIYDAVVERETTRRDGAVFMLSRLQSRKPPKVAPNWHTSYRLQAAALVAVVKLGTYGERLSRDRQVRLLARLEMLYLALPALISRHTNPFPATARCARWPAWKCVVHEDRASHPGTPTPPARDRQLQWAEVVSIDPKDSRAETKVRLWPAWKCL